MQKFIIILFLFLVSVHTKNPQLTQHSLPIYGNASIGYYFVKLFVGHPPQEQSVIVDTGSGQLALPCNKCTNCNPHHIDKPFDLTKSKTAEYVTCESSDNQCKRCTSKSPTEPCKFMISYAEGSSLQGIIIKDSIQFQSFSQGQQIVTSFGCTTRQTNLFLKQQANGIFGLSPDRTSTLLQDLYGKHHTFSGEQLKFSLCLASNGGLMTIGKINEALHKNNLSVKTTFSSQRNVYSLNGVGNIKIGQTFIHRKNDKLGLYGVFIDSGSTFSYFPRQNYLTFKKQLLASCTANNEICKVATGESVMCFHLKGQKEISETADDIFSPIKIEIGQQQIEWKASNYFLLRDSSYRQICLAIESLDRYLLGANWMVNRDIVVNLREKSLQIFSGANCLNKENQIRRMSQFTEDVDGHKPLSYEQGVGGFIQTIKSSYVLIVFGVVLILAGVVGIVILVLRRNQRKKTSKHNLVKPPISTIQTQDHMQMSTTFENNSSIS